MPSSQKSRDFLLPQGQPASKHVLLFSDLLVYPRKQRHSCNSLSCKLLPQLIDSSATKGLFFFLDRLLSYSSLPHSSSAPNDCRVVLTFQVNSFFNVHLLSDWQAQAMSNTIASLGMPANVHTSNDEEQDLVLLETR